MSKKKNLELTETEDFSIGKINIYEDEISDDEGSKSGDGGSHCRGFEKNIDKLLKLQLFESKVHDEVEKQNMEKVDSEAIKSKYDRRIYELDVYKTVLQKIDGYDYRYPKGNLD